MKRLKDKSATKIIKRATYSGPIPAKFLILEYIMWILVFLPFAIMSFDLMFGWTPLSPAFYVYASACAISLLVTVKIAKKERKNDCEAEILTNLTVQKTTEEGTT